MTDRTVWAIGAIAVALALMIACGEPDGGDGGRAHDGAAGGPDGGVDPDGGPTDRADGGGSGAGPGLIETVCPALTMPSALATVYVDAAAGGAEDGTLGAPYHTIAKALSNAGTGGVVWISAGTYKENVEIPDKGLVVYGGFSPGFTARTDACATVLEAADGSAPVLTASSSVKSFGLDGVTVQKGARGLSVSGDASVSSTYAIHNSVFADNGETDTVGGGAFLDRVNATISGSVFRDNRAEKGAAIAHGGDASTITIEASLFERNVGHSDHGGALYLSPKTATIVRSTFRGNEIGRTAGYGWGGAVIVYKAGSAPVHADFAYNVFTENLASVGGAVFIDDGASATMSHDLLFRNRSITENGVARGAALYVDGQGSPSGGSSLVADHLTVVDNVYDSSGTPTTARGGGVYLETYSTASFTSSIFWHDGGEALFGDATCSITVRYSIAPSACAGGATCTIGDGVFEPPQIHFVDEAKGDYHEQSTAGHYTKGGWVADPVTSPAIDKGNPAESPANEPAPNGGRTNLGVFGGTAEASRSPS